MHRLGDRVELGDRAQVRVRVCIAGGVLELDVAPELLALPNLDDLAVVDRDHRRAGVGVDIRAVAVGVRLDGHGGVRALDSGLGQLEDGVVGVLGRRRDGEVAVDQAGERVDERLGHAADQFGSQHHRLDVPPGVVVSEDRALDALGGAGRVQIARGGEDRVGRVVRIGDAVPVRVDAPLLPRRGEELHPAHGAGGRHRQVAAVVGLDLVDRGQDLPRHVVLAAGRLIDRKQEGRDLEAVDEEVRDADWRRAGHGVGVGRVGRRRYTARGDRRGRLRSRLVRLGLRLGRARLLEVASGGSLDRPARTPVPSPSPSPCPCPSRRWWTRSGLWSSASSSS